MSVTGRPINIVIVEDNPAIANMYAFKLEHEGHVVRLAPNGAIGLQVCREEQPDIVLLDLMMPVMGGEEMLQKLRATEWGASIRVVILTNLSKSEAPHALRFLSVDRYVVKAHTTPAQVADIVHEVLGVRN